MDDFTFLLQVAAEPERFLPCWIYADWLEEQGNPAAARWHASGYPSTSNQAQILGRPSIIRRGAELLTTEQRRRLAVWFLVIAPKSRFWPLPGSERTYTDLQTYCGLIDQACGLYADSSLHEPGSPEYWGAYQRRRTQIFLGMRAMYRNHPLPDLAADLPAESAGWEI